jgi:hypothetical protein
MTHSEIRAQLAFRLTGLKTDEGTPASARQLRPALTARHRNLANLRYGFPLVLSAEPQRKEFAVSLCTIFDKLLEDIAPAEGANLRQRHAMLRLEREIRVVLAQGASGTLRSLWDLAASRLCAAGDETVAGDLARALGALRTDGEVVDCNGAFPARFVLQAWRAVQKERAVRFREDLESLIRRLSDILSADEARSPQSRTAARLRESMGTLHRDAFDFDALSRIVARGGAWRPLTDARRRRIRTLLVALESQRFFMDDSGYTFVFDRCAPALRAFRARYPRLRSLARSMAMARLEAEGTYDAAEHEALFNQLKESPVSREELARYPDYLVCLNDSTLDAGGRDELVDLLASGIPAKVLLQTDDLLEATAAEDGLAAVGARADAITGLALGLNDVFVLQSSASHLPQMADALLRSLSHPGAALISVFSGATGDSAVLPPYLNAAAAMESRAFPAFTYDPSIAPDAGPRFDLAGNPQPGHDWPVHAFDYEDREHQRVRRELPFTVADFLAADDRLRAHFMPVAPTSAALTTVPAWLGEQALAEDASPSIAMVDGNDVLREVIVDEAALDLARRTQDRWRRLQRWSSKAAPTVTGEAPASVVAEPAPVAAKAAAAEQAAAPVAEASAPSTGEAYIETPRCTSCDECTQVNARMFAYDANKQAYIADATAGTYRQLVEAAENCQVSIIHPGKPRDPNEPGIAELLERAAAFG